MEARRVTAAVVLAACVLALYLLGVHAGVVEPGPLEPLYRLAEPLLVRLLGPPPQVQPATPHVAPRPRRVRVVFEPLLPRGVPASAVVVLPDGRVYRPAHRAEWNVTVEASGGWFCWNTTAVRAGYVEYVPVNGSGCVLVANDTVVRVAYRALPLVCIATDAPIAVDVNVSGRVLRVSQRPACVAVENARIVAPLRGPSYDAERVWWLEWARVRPNGSAEQEYWWSPLLNGSVLRLAGGGLVVLHYYPGLKDLPYVYDVYGFPTEWFLGETPTLRGGPPFEVSIAGGWVRLHSPKPFNLTYSVGKRKYEWGFNGPGRPYLYSALLELDPAARVAVVEVRVPAWRQNQSRSLHLQLFSILRPGFATYNTSMCGVWDENDTYWLFNFTLSLEHRPGDRCPIYIGGYGLFNSKWFLGDDAALIVRGRAPYFLVFYAPQSGHRLVHYKLYDFTPLYNSSYTLGLVELRVTAVHP